MSNSGTPDPSPGWNDAPWESSLSQGSLNQPSSTAQPDAPSPFSRQGSDPSDELGVGPAPTEPPATPPTGAAASGGSSATWPSYPTTGSADQPAASAGSYGGYPSATPYGQPSAPNFDPQPTPPYGGGYTSPAAPAEPAGAYGSNPYASNPYETNPYQPAENPYAPTPYQASYGGYGAYGIVPTIHPQAVPALVTGILGLLLCPAVGIVGLVLGNKARRAIDAEPGRYSGRGQATAGFVLGILSAIYLVLWVVFVVAGVSGAFDDY